MSDEPISSLITIADGSLAEAKTLRQNFNYLDSKITDQSSLVANKETISHKGAANGYCPLDGNAKIPTQYLSLLESHLVPVGAILMWGTTTPPTNWIPMLGQDITEFTTLVSVLGRTSLPNTAGTFPEGANNSTFPPFTYIPPGLPNITGSAMFTYWTWGSPWANGAFSTTGYNYGFTQGGGSGGAVYNDSQLNFNAAYSNGIYGRSDTVQPNTYTFLFIIKYQ